MLPALSGALTGSSIQFLLDQDSTRVGEPGIDDDRDQPGTQRRRSIQQGNSVICYGKGGEIASNGMEEHEMTVLCLRIGTA